VQYTITSFPLLQCFLIFFPQGNAGAPGPRGRDGSKGIRVSLLIMITNNNFIIMSIILAYCNTRLCQLGLTYVKKELNNYDIRAINFSY